VLWFFRVPRIVATDLKIAALHIADYSSQFFVPRRDMNFI
jgi:hypothetical protein